MATTGMHSNIEGEASNETAPLIESTTPDYLKINCNKNNYKQEKKISPHKQNFLSKSLPFIYGAIFGTALWPILFIIMTYLILNNSPKSPFSSKFKKSKSLNTQNRTNISMIKSKNVTFDDIAGLNEAKMELTEIVHYIRNPEPYEKLGARLPKGVLLAGPPGSGKTMLANAVATEASIPYLYVSGSEFVEIFVGQGAKRVRQLFNAARNISPCIIFIDELDAVGGHRNAAGLNGSHREHDQTLNQLLVELDGFSTTSGIVILAATNRIDSLDHALLRPGRFDRIIQIGLPDIEGRKEIIRIYLNNLPSTKSDKVITSLAKMTSGFSGADLENLINEAAILAARTSKTNITEKELYEARDKVAMGPERKSLSIPTKQRNLTAFHEAGHALVAYFLHPDTDPIHKITIISRGNALGFVEQIPSEDRYGFSRSQLEARLAVIMGGRAAELIIFGKNQITSGASSDIKTATIIAYKMVCEWGMSDKIGPLSCKSSNLNFISNQLPSLSPKTSSIIEDEVKSLISKAQNKAEDILRKHKKELHLIANTLLEKETLSGEELESLLISKRSTFPFSIFQVEDTVDTNSTTEDSKIK